MALQLSKKNPRTFFSQNQKFKQAKMCINLKLYKDLITESQQISKIEIRKFAIFRSSLIFMEKLFKLFSSLLLSIFQSYKLYAVQLKPEEPWFQ